jgi:hypothetical protein
VFQVTDGWTTDTAYVVLTLKRDCQGNGIDLFFAAPERPG